MNTPDMDRRNFLKKSALGAGVMVLPSFVAGQSSTQKAPGSRLNIAIVGVAGRGGSHVISLANENIVALCDVDRGHVANSRKPRKSGPNEYNEVLTNAENKGAKWFSDYRVMFEEMADKIDAVVIATPDHMHFPIALSAINLGKHVYCEKPLTHTVEEARVLAAAAAEKGVRTQMGNQGHSMEGCRLVREWIAAGVIGQVKEVHSWTNRPAAYWPQGLAKPDHSEYIPVVPKELDWNLWLGVAENRPYDPAYAPFKWRGYNDFGCGALGDMACHIMDSAFWGLDLGSPTDIEGVTSPMNGYMYPSSSIVSFNFPARGNMAPLTYKWYDGFLYPPLPAFLKDLPSLQSGENQNGTLIIGEDTAILCSTYSETIRIVPDDKFMELKPSLPPKTLRRVKGNHMQEWVNAITESRPASSDFSYAGPFTETVLLGCVAQQVGRKVKFNGKKGKFENDKVANSLLKKEYPKGWILS